MRPQLGRISAVRTAYVVARSENERNSSLAWYK